MWGDVTYRTVVPGPVGQELWGQQHQAASKPSPIEAEPASTFIKVGTSYSNQTQQH